MRRSGVFALRARTLKIFSFAAVAALFVACSNLGDDYAGAPAGFVPGTANPGAVQGQQNYLTARVAVEMPGAAVAQKISASSAEMTVLKKVEKNDRHFKCH